MIAASRLIALCLLAAVVITVLAAGWLAPAPYDRQHRDSPSAAPSRQFPLGTDELGRDRASRLLHGARVSLLLAPLAALTATLLAAVIGGTAGWCGGWVDRALMASSDLVVSVPWLFLLITARAMLPLDAAPWLSIAVTVALLGGLGWAPAARAIRTGVRQLAHSEFLVAARASGIGRLRLLFVHTVPNVRGLVAAQFWTAVPAFLLAEANLSLLGLGVADPMPSLGNLLRELESVHAVRQQPVILAPLGCLMTVILCCHLAFAARPEAAR